MPFGLVILIPVLLWLFYSPIPALVRKYYQRHKLRCPNDKQELILTFDDGPDERYTAQLLEVLERYHVKAVFFVVGNKALKRHELVDEILKRGHQIGFHSMNHQNSLWQSPWRQQKDFRYWQAIAQSYHWRVSYYRPPWGFANLMAMHLARKARLPILYWSYLIGDWDSDNDAKTLLHRLVSRAQNGAVFCLHDSGQDTGGDPDAAYNTICALEQFIPLMQRQGYQFVLPKEVRNERNSTTIS